MPITAEILQRLKSKDAKLKHLDILDEILPLNDIKALAEALSKNNTLQYLDLNYFEINVEGMKLLANALETNTGLIRLNFAFCYSPSNLILEFFAIALEKNNTLLTLEFGGCPYSPLTVTDPTNIYFTRMPYQSWTSFGILDRAENIKKYELARNSYVLRETNRFLSSLSHKDKYSLGQININNEDNKEPVYAALVALGCTQRISESLLPDKVNSYEDIYNHSRKLQKRKIMHSSKQYTDIDEEAYKAWSKGKGYFPNKAALEEYQRHRVLVRKMQNIIWNSVASSSQHSKSAIKKIHDKLTINQTRKDQKYQTATSTTLNKTQDTKTSPDAIANIVSCVRLRADPFIYDQMDTKQSVVVLNANLTGHIAISDQVFDLQKYLRDIKENKITEIDLSKQKIFKKSLPKLEIFKLDKPKESGVRDDILLTNNQIMRFSDCHTLSPLINLLHLESKKQEIILAPAIWSYISSTHTVELNDNHGAVFFTGSYADHSIYIWNLDTLQFITKLIGHSASLKSVKRLENDQILSTDINGFSKIWDIKSGQCIVSFSRFESSTTEGPSNVRILPTNQNNIIELRSYNDLKIEHYRINSDSILTPDLKTSLDINIYRDYGDIRIYCVLKNGHFAVVHTNAIAIWDPNTGQLVALLPELFKAPEKIEAAAKKHWGNYFPRDSDGYLDLDGYCDHYDDISEKIDLLELENGLLLFCRQIREIKSRLLKLSFWNIKNQTCVAKTEHLIDDYINFHQTPSGKLFGYGYTTYVTCNLGTKPLTLKDLQPLFESLYNSKPSNTNNSTVKQINLRNVLIKDEDLWILIALLEKNITLLQIDIRDTFISDKSLNKLLTVADKRTPKLTLVHSPVTVTFTGELTYSRIDPIKYKWQLASAAALGDEKLVQKLLEMGASLEAIDDMDPHGFRPLHYAVAGGILNSKNLKPGHTAVVKLFLDQKADHEAKTKEGFTPLMLACRSHHFAAIQMLLEVNANVHVKGPQAQTLLHFLAKPEKIIDSKYINLNREVIITTVKLLFSKGIELEAKDSGRETAVQLAKYFGMEDLFIQLIEEEKRKRFQSISEGKSNNMAVTFAQSTNTVKSIPSIVTQQPTPTAVDYKNSAAVAIPYSVVSEQAVTTKTDSKNKEAKSDKEIISPRLDQKLSHSLSTTTAAVVEATATAYTAYRPTLDDKSISSMPPINTQNSIASITPTATPSVTPVASIVATASTQPTISPELATWLQDLKNSGFEITSGQTFSQQMQLLNAAGISWAQIIHAVDEIKQRLTQLDNHLSIIDEKLELDPIARAEQAYIDRHPKLLNYQRKLRQELTKFITAYFIATSDVFKLADNKKGTVLTALGNAPVVGSFLKIFTVGLKYANDKYRAYEINRLTKLFNGINKIEHALLRFSRQLTLAKKVEIEGQVTFTPSGVMDKLRGFYESMKEVLYLMLHDQKVSDSTGLTFKAEEKLALLDGAFLIEQVLSSKKFDGVEVPKDLAVVPIFLQIILKDPHYQYQTPADINVVRVSAAGVVIAPIPVMPVAVATNSMPTLRTPRDSIFAAEKRQTFVHGLQDTFSKKGITNVGASEADQLAERFSSLPAEILLEAIKANTSLHTHDFLVIILAYCGAYLTPRPAVKLNDCLPRSPLPLVNQTSAKAERQRQEMKKAFQHELAKQSNDKQARVQEIRQQLQTYLAECLDQQRCFEKQQHPTLFYFKLVFPLRLHELLIRSYLVRFDPKMNYQNVAESLSDDEIRSFNRVIACACPHIENLQKFVTLLSPLLARGVVMLNHDKLSACKTYAEINQQMQIFLKQLRLAVLKTVGNTPNLDPSLFSTLSKCTHYLLHCYIDCGDETATAKIQAKQKIQHYINAGNPQVMKTSFSNRVTQHQSGGVRLPNGTLFMAASTQHNQAKLNGDAKQTTQNKVTVVLTPEQAEKLHLMLAGNYNTKCTIL